MSRIGISHVVRRNESCRTYEWVLRHIWMSLTRKKTSDVRHRNESCHTSEWVMSYVQISHVARTNEWFVCATCRVSQWVAMCCSELQCDAVSCILMQWVAVCRSVPQCVAVCRSVFQCVAVCCSVCRVVQCVVVCYYGGVVCYVYGRIRPHIYATSYTYEGPHR